MSDNTQVKREALERICLHAETLKRMHGYIYPASDKWPGDIEYVRADLLATVRREAEAAEKIGRQAFAAELLGHLDRITSTTAAFHFVRNSCKIELGQEPDSLGAEIDH